MIVCAATNNAGKLKELRRILTRCGHEVKSLRELGVTLDPEETGTTLRKTQRLRLKPFARQPACPPWRMIPACAWMPERGTRRVQRTLCG